MPYFHIGQAQKETRQRFVFLEETVPFPIWVNIPWNIKRHLQTPLPRKPASVNLHRY